ncbi:methylated-DNA--[protein]-cysteine S-methyltransferase [Alloalcanivorax xenomutans]|uniref:methylated-DNA--[protein]-cysteine S-methyltransferase n=1 Tax=Alloalcanivorax xenomutans TaxID=1094342 RepID=UPI003D9B426C
MIEYHALPTSLGALLLAAEDDALVGAWFEGQKYHPDPRPWRHNPAHPLLVTAADQVRAYFSGERRDFDLPLAPRGTEFQRQVWGALREIRCGNTSTYGELAHRLGRPRAVRAVGAAVGRNPCSVIIPCHRVLGANGSLTGYAGGIDRKARLLALEGGVPNNGSLFD